MSNFDISCYNMTDFGLVCSLPDINYQLRGALIFISIYINLGRGH